MVDYRIGYGQTFSYFKKITVSRTTYGDPNDGYRCDIQIPFVCQGFSLSNQTGSVVSVSFDGFTDHDELDTTLVTKFVQYDNRVVSKMWFKVPSATATVVVRIWGTR